MFLHVSVILLTGGVSGEPTPPDQGEPPQPRRTPPRTKENPPRTKENPLGPRRTPPGPGRPPRGRTLQHTVNERPVRILLECILVYLVNLLDIANIIFYRSLSYHLLHLLHHFPQEHLIKVPFLFQGLGEGTGAGDWTGLDVGRLE